MGWHAGGSHLSGSRGHGGVLPEDTISHQTSALLTLLHTETLRSPREAESGARARLTDMNTRTTVRLPLIKPLICL